MAVHQLPSERLTTNEQLKTTASLRMEIQDDISRLQAVIKSANETIKRARLTIVQLSLHEDRAYAMEAEAAALDTPPATLPIRA